MAIAGLKKFSISFAGSRPRLRLIGRPKLISNYVTLRNRKMKKKIAIITLAFFLGLLCSNFVTAQIYMPRVNPEILGQVKYQPPQTQPTINQRLIRERATTPHFGQRERDMIRHINPGPISQDTLILPPGINLRPVDPPQGLLPRPVPPQLFPIPPQPFPAPQPLPQPQPQGPTLQFGPGGPSVSFGNGPHINIPVGQIVDRLRDRRGLGRQRR